MTTTDTTSPAVAKLLYTPLEAAAALGISRSSLYELLAAGHIRSVRIGASRRIPIGALTDYIDTLEGPSQPAATMTTSSQPRPRR